jgi:DNA polymerase elongation subunit (family B)
MKLLSSLPIHQILFLDIETVPVVENYNLLSDNLKTFWDRKFNFIKHETDMNSADGFFNHAGVYSEFSKIICISVGRFKIENEKNIFSVKSFSNENEQQLLEEFNTVFENRNDFKFIAGHNIKEFDVPFICRRMIVNQISIPSIFDLSGKKSFEVNHLIDTLQLWKFGDFKHYTSLALLTEIMGIETPKTDMEGKDVAHVFYKENNLKKIAKYCRQDVVAVAQLFLKFRKENLLTEDEIKMLED